MTAAGWRGSACRRTPASHPAAWRASRGPLADVIGWLLGIEMPRVEGGGSYVAARDGVYDWVPPRAHVEPTGGGCARLAAGAS